MEFLLKLAFAPRQPGLAFSSEHCATGLKRDLALNLQLFTAGARSLGLLWRCLLNELGFHACCGLRLT